MGILEGRAAIITGASSGVGRGCALKFAEEGASLVVCARRKEKLESLVDEITAKGGKAVAVSCDVANEADIDEVVNTCIREYKKVDILANIAQGGMDEQKYLEEVTVENALLAYKTGPLQSLLFIQKCLPYMKEAHYGRIINCASQSALMGAKGYTAYAMAKGSVMALTRIAAKELGKYGIVTNTFLPIIKTESYDFSEQGRAAAKMFETAIPTGYFGTPYEDCAPIVAFLASEGAGYINAQAIAVDGGYWPIA